MRSTPEQRLLKIGEAAERVGLSLRTVRHWEEVGLVTPSARSTGGFRLFNESDLERLLVVKHMKPLGLTLGEMRELLLLIEQSQSTDLDEPARSQLITELDQYATQARERIDRIKRDLKQAQALLTTIELRLATIRQPRKALTLEPTLEPHA